MQKILFLIIFIGVVFFFGLYFGQKKMYTNQPSKKPTASLTRMKENIYTDAYFDFSFTYPKGWMVTTKMSKNRPCEMTKKFMKNPNCTIEDLTTETVYINSPEKDTNNKSYGITIETATEGLGFACADNIEKNYLVTVKEKAYKFSACQDFKSKEEWGMGEMVVTGPKSEWKAILVNFSTKDETMTKEILQILQSVQ
ncbi:hypothetical protein HY041_00730 [Candidatus Roizmanbacteria bacterium]|nr:hypothetical protein [Candidatus Roizmanbacteria bacterium]